MNSQIEEELVDALEDVIAQSKTPLGKTSRRVPRESTEEGSTGSMPASNDQPNRKKHAS